MEQLLSLLKTIPEYAAMVSSLQDGESVAVTGIGQINRSHMIAGLCRTLNRPMVVLSTASPYKFPAAVLAAVGGDTSGSEFDQMARLSAMTGVPIPKNLAGLQGKPERHTGVINKEDMLDYVLHL